MRRNRRGLSPMEAIFGFILLAITYGILVKFGVMPLPEFMNALFDSNRCEADFVKKNNLDRNCVYPVVSDDVSSDLSDCIGLAVKCDVNGKCKIRYEGAPEICTCEIMGNGACIGDREFEELTEVNTDVEVCWADLGSTSRNTRKILCDDENLV